MATQEQEQGDYKELQGQQTQPSGKRSSMVSLDFLTEGKLCKNGQIMYRYIDGPIDIVCIFQIIH